MIGSVRFAALEKMNLKRLNDLDAEGPEALDSLKHYISKPQEFHENGGLRPSMRTYTDK